MTDTTYIVKTASARPSADCWGTYRRVAVLEVEVGAEPAMISRRARGVVRVVETWENCNVGKTERCAYQRALAEARALVDELNADPPGPMESSRRAVAAHYNARRDGGVS